MEEDEEEEQTSGLSQILAGVGFAVAVVVLVLQL
ncbi:MAG: hypothetical protein RLZZ282_166, partial [Verrucomicrobiota bacterium]